MRWELLQSQKVDVHIAVQYFWLANYRFHLVGQKTRRCMCKLTIATVQVNQTTPTIINTNIITITMNIKYSIKIKINITIKITINVNTIAMNINIDIKLRHHRGCM